MKSFNVSSQLKKSIFYISSVVLVYALVGFLVLPAVLSNQIPSLVNKHLGRIAQVDKVKINPFSLELSLHDLAIKSVDNEGFVSFESLSLNIGFIQSMMDLSLTLEEVLLERPFLLIKRTKEGDFNFSDLLPVKEPDKGTNKEQTDIFPVNVMHAAISNGKISWEDHLYSNIKKEDISPLNLEINNFSTQVNKHSKLDVVLGLTSGGVLEWQGDLSINPLMSTGVVKLDHLDFHQLWGLFPSEKIKIDILEGSESIRADYQLFESAGSMQLLVSNANIDIFNVKLSELENNKPIIFLPDLKVSGIAINLQKKTVEIDSITSRNAHFNAWLKTDGVINYQTLFTENSSPEKTAIQKSSTDGVWVLKVDELALNNYSLNFVDNTTQKPANLSISGFNITAAELSSDPTHPLDFKLDLIVNDKGSLNVIGTTVFEPLLGDFQIKANNIAIKDFQPYIDQALQVDVISGFLNSQINLKLTQKDKEPLGLNLKGNSSVANFVTRDKKTHKDFLTWKQLNLTAIDIDLAENRYFIDKVRWVEPYAKVLIRKDKTTNVADIFVSNKANKNTVETGGAPHIEIKNIELSGGQSDFSDLSLILPFSVHMNKLSGSVREISSDENVLAKIDLVGQVAGLSPVSIQGGLKPFQGDSEIDLNFQSLPLPLITPYMAEFAGRKIKKGNMTLGLNYKIQNKQLNSSNNLLIEQLVLGEAVENPNAVSLPLGLAIALMEDKDGKIKLNIPVSGQLDDPKFSISGIIVKALVNVIGKIISSPFSAIASLVGTDEDMSSVLFSAGKTGLNEVQQTKLDTLSTALLDRPLLNIEIQGVASSIQDWPELQSNALRQTLLTMKVNELNNNQKNKVLTENIKLSDKDYKKLLADLFIKTHPELATRNLLGKPKLIKPSEVDFYTIAKQIMASKIPPNLSSLEELAKKRAQMIASHLVNQGIDIKKIFLLDVKVDEQDKKGGIVSSLNLVVR